MVYLAAILSCGLLVQLLRTTLTTKAVSKLRRLSANALIPFVGAIALVSAIYSYLSIRVHRQDMDALTISELYELEAKIPSWATAVGGFFPPWAAVLLAVVGLLLGRAAVDRSEEPAVPDASGLLLRGAKGYGLGVTWVSAILGAASAFTLFGDGLRDIESDAKKRIHEAQVRILATQDRAVRELGRAIAEQTIEKMVQTADDSSLPFLQAYRMLQLRLADVHATHMAAYASRPVTPDQAMRILADMIWADHKPSMATKWPWSGERKPWDWKSDAGPVRPKYLDSLPTKVPDPISDVAKEFVNAGLSSLKDVLTNEPVLAFFFDAMSSAVSESLAIASMESKLKPMLDRIFQSIASGSMRNSAADEAREFVQDIDTAAHWRAHVRPSTEVDEAMGQTIVATERLINGPLPDRSTALDESAREQLLRLVKRHNLWQMNEMLEAGYAELAMKPANVEIAHDVRVIERAAMEALPLALQQTGHSSGTELFLRRIKSSMKSSQMDQLIPRTEAERLLRFYKLIELNKAKGGVPGIVVKPRPIGKH